MRQIFLAGEKPNHRPSLMRDVIPNGTAQRGIACLKGIKEGILGNGPVDGDMYLAVDSCQRSQMIGKDDTDHGNVWTSTESTPGRSRTTAFQLSPASAET